jgi:hypothetical protein
MIQKHRIAKQMRKEYKKAGKRKIRAMKRGGASYQQIGEFISRFRRDM